MTSKQKPSRQSIVKRVFDGDPTLTREDIYALYPNMPKVAAAIWENIASTRRPENERKS